MDPGFSSNDPRTQSASSAETDLCRRGRYQESDSRIQDLTHNFLDDCTVQNELALACLFQDNFGKLLHLVGSSNGLGTRQASFNQLLLDYGRLHVDLMLDEAVKSSQQVWEKWINGKSMEEYDDIDVYIFCLYHIIHEFGRKLLGGDEWMTRESPARVPMAQLRHHLLRTERIKKILPVLHAESILCSAPQIISNLLETLSYFPNTDKTPPSVRDVEAWIRILLARAFGITKKMSECNEQLCIAQRLFEKDGTQAGCLWARFHSIYDNDNAIGRIHEFQELVEKFRDIEDYRGVRKCMFAIAEIHQRSGQHAQYHTTILSGLETIVGCLPRSWSQARVSSDDAEKIACSFRPNRGSMFSFWQNYLALMPNDVKASRSFATALELASRFFTLQPHCSIPQLQLALSTELSELYDERTANKGNAIKWASEATRYADATGLDDLILDAQSRLRILLAGNDVRPAEDPYGFELPEWNRAQKRDVEIAFEEAGQAERWEEQFVYAKQLLVLQLSAEVKEKAKISGEPWLTEARAVLQKLSGATRSDGRYAIDRCVAHAIFESGDTKKAALLYSQLIKDFTPTDQISRLYTLFTFGEVRLHGYRETQDHGQWEESYQAFESVAQESMGEHDRPDVTACCHCMLAELWRARGIENEVFALQALHHISQAESLWNQERDSIWNIDGLDGLLTRFSLRHRNESGPTDVFAIAYDACFGSNDAAEGWRWAQKAKARAYSRSLHNSGERDISIPHEFGPSVDIGSTTDALTNEFDLAWLHTASEKWDGIVCVDWVTAEDTIYMISLRIGRKPLMRKLDIDLPTVRQWYSDLSNTNDDLRDSDTAEETLSELDALCTPLAEISRPGELLLLCPTKVISKIPLHALNVGGQTLLARNPVIYTYALSVLEQCFWRVSEQRKSSPMILFGNPTGDAPGGTRSVMNIGTSMHADTFVEEHATVEKFKAMAPLARLVHYHGHVVVRDQPLNHAIIFRDSPLTARDIFSLDLRKNSPFVSVIGCGSGVEQFKTGDEPLGLISSFLYAGASTVLATLWPINDTLSGEPFSRSFYEEFVVLANNMQNEKPVVVHLARALQKAALGIRSHDATKAPYYWAGYVLHGKWTFQL